MKMKMKYNMRGKIKAKFAISALFCVRRTLQLHFPVRSAQAHTCLSKSHVWLSDPEKLHSHWVHCGKSGSGQGQACVIYSTAGRGGASRACLSFLLHQTRKLQNEMLPSSHCMSAKTSLKFR